MRRGRAGAGGGGGHTAPRRPSRTPAERVRGVVGWLLTGALVAVLVWFGWPTTLGGCTTLTIVSGHSMEPTYRTGDLVVSRCGTPERGDIVVYAPPGVDGGRVIHRVVAGDAATGWTMQGDNNDFLDPWRPRQDDVVGVARVHLPGVGRVAAVLLDPWAWASLLVVAVGVLLWPGRGDREDAAGAVATGAVAAGAVAAGADAGADAAP